MHIGEQPLMQVTTKGRYAARIMVYLARYRGGGPAAKQGIADAEDISIDYVEQIMIRLKAAQLVRSHRGRNGGFTLAREPGDITLDQIVRAMEGPVCVAPCLDGTCSRQESCPVRPTWKRATEAVEAVFRETTVEAMAREVACDPRAVCRGR